MNKLNKTKDYLLTLSKFIDYKINNNKLKYRYKKGDTLIEEVAIHLVSKLSNTNLPTIYADLKILKQKLNLKQKELKVFKLLVAKNLITYIYQNKIILDDLLKIIKKSKNAKYLHFYDNLLCFYAQIYGICQNNQNSKALMLTNNISEKYCISQFFKQLYLFQNRINLALNYLITLFN